VTWTKVWGFLFFFLPSTPEMASRSEALRAEQDLPEFLPPALLVPNDAF